METFSILWFSQIEGKISHWLWVFWESSRQRTIDLLLKIIPEILLPKWKPWRLIQWQGVEKLLQFLVGAQPKQTTVITRFVGLRVGLSRKNGKLFFLKKTDTIVDNMIMLTKGNVHFRENKEANIPQDTTIFFLWLNISSKWCSMALLYYVWAIAINTFLYWKQYTHLKILINKTFKTS